MPRWEHTAAAVLVALAIGSGLGWWAASQILVSETTTGSTEVVTAEVREVTVSRELSLNAVARREVTPVGRNVRGGTITRVSELNAPIDSGTLLYSVNEQPVIAIAGVVPFYRMLEAGMAGDDVFQLQQALFLLGFQSAEPDGRFGTVTTRAVRAWQESMALEPTGKIPHGMLVAIDALPRTVKLSEQIIVGAQLAGGELAVDALAAEPEFVVPLSSDQLQLVRVGAEVQLTLADRLHLAQVVEIRQGVAGVELILAAPDGGLVCGESCDGLVPAQTETVFGAKVVLVPETTGAAVPEPALRSLADGRTTVLVRSTEGTFDEIEVQVRATAEGLVVVDGIDIGTVVLVGAEP